MANFTQIIQEINDDINTNGVGAITGAKLNEVLRDMIAAVNAEKQDPLTIDATPTEDSTNPVQSGGVFTALANLITNGCLFGGEVSPQEQIPHGNDHGYFYLAIKDGIYTNFSSSIVLTNCIAIIFWDTNAQNWGFLEINYNVDYVDNELNGKQDTISDLADIRSGAAAGAAASTRVAEIDGMIPAQASASNKLADKNFVNSSITTSTANFVGTYNSLAELQAVQNPTNNDYGFVIETDAQGNQYYDRYKYNGTAWLFEYKVESTAFTAAQWAAIQSGITAGLVNRLGEIIPAGATAQNPLATVGDIEKIDVVDATTIPASMEPNKLYKYGTLSGDTVFPSLATPTDQSRANVYWWKFTTPASTINVQMPSAITIWNGGQAPTIDPSTTYEITVEDGFGTCIKS